MPDLSLAELKRFDGKNGNPTYVAIRGIVYDVSDHVLFLNGEHVGIHSCGKDLTVEISQAPHDEDVLSELKKIGRII